MQTSGKICYAICFYIFVNILFSTFFNVFSNICDIDMHDVEIRNSPAFTNVSFQNIFSASHKIICLECMLSTVISSTTS